jgi:hypothetical protein
VKEKYELGDTTVTVRAVSAAVKQSRSRTVIVILVDSSEDCQLLDTSIKAATHLATLYPAHPLPSTTSFCLLPVADVEAAL